jgi:NLR family CARD domain-containing protein 3
MGGVLLPGCFIECAEGGGRGGVDFGFLSTTTNESVAVRYIGGKKMPVLFQFDVGDIDRGASLSFLVCVPTYVCNLV